MMQWIWSIPYLGTALWHAELFVRQVCRYGFRGALKHRREMKELLSKIS